MALKFDIQGNKVLVFKTDFSETIPFEASARDVHINIHPNGNSKYMIEGIDGVNGTVNFSDIQDKNGNPFQNEEQWQEWYRTNTSANSSSNGDNTTNTVTTVEREVQLFGSISNPDANIYSNTFTLPSEAKSYAFVVQDGKLEKINQGIDAENNSFTDPKVTYQTGAGGSNGGVNESISNTNITFTAIGDDADIIIRYNL